MTTDEVLDDLPIGDEEEETQASGIPDFVNLPTETAEDEDEYEEETEDEYEEEDEEPAEEAQATQTTIEEPDAENGPSNASEEDTPDVSTEGELSSEEGEEGLPAPAEPAATVPVAVAELPAEAAAAKVATAGPKGGTGKENPDRLPAVKVHPPDVQLGAGDVVVQTGKPEPRILDVGETLPMETLRKWDGMMSGFSKGTRLAVWETGINNLQDLLNTPTKSLIKPRGPLTAEQLTEVEEYLAENLGFKLPKTKVEAGQVYVPPPIPVVPGEGGTLPVRRVTPEMAAARRDRLNGMRGDSRRCSKQS